MTDKSATKNPSAELLQQIDDGLDELGAALDAGMSEKLIAFLDCMSRFHRYSFGNVFLIAMQRPDATNVAGFNAWKQFGRHVRKGERGIRILAPLIRKKKPENEDSDPGSEDNEEPKKRVVGYRVVHVFDVAQTDGDPLPEFERTQGDPGEYTQRLRELVGDLGIRLETDTIPSGADGVSRGGEITIRPGLLDAEYFSTLVHEMAHEALHRTERRSATTKRIRETEAEAVAFVVSKAIGLETGTASSDYVQLYGGNNETLQESLHHIRECAAMILNGIMPSDATSEPTSGTSGNKVPPQ